MDIPHLLDKTKSLEYQAKKAFESRNEFRTKARILMEDQKTADFYNKRDTNVTWEQIVVIKSKDFFGDDLWNSIIESSQKYRESINQQFNFIGDRHP